MAIYWIAHYPSGTSPDTKEQWSQIHGIKPYSNIHAIGHTIFLKMLLHIYDSYAIVIFAHILMIATVMAVFAKYVFSKGANFSWIVFLTILFSACTATGAAYIYPWKDTPYTICLAVCTYFIIRSLDDSYQIKYTRTIILGLAMAFSLLFRHNGIVSLLFCSAYFLYYFIRTKSFKKLIVTIITMVLAFSTINFYAYRVLDTQRPSNATSIHVFATGISAVVANDRNITDDQRQRLAELLPMDWMEENYTPFNNTTLVWRSQEFNSALAEHKTEVVKMYFELLPNNLLICAKDVLYNTHMIWGFSTVENSMFFYSNIFLLLILSTAVVVSWSKATLKKRWVIFLPVAGNIISIAISTITNEPRYLLPTFMLFAPLLLYILSTKDHKPEISHGN